MSTDSEPELKLWPDPSQFHPLIQLEQPGQPMHPLDASLFMELIHRADSALMGLWRTAEVPDSFRTRRDELTGGYASILAGPHAARFGSVDLYPRPFHETWPIVIVPTQMLVEAVEALEALALEYFPHEISDRSTGGLRTLPRSNEIRIKARNKLEAVGALHGRVVPVRPPFESPVAADTVTASGAVASGVDGHSGSPSVVGGASTVGNGGAGSDAGSARRPVGRRLTALELFLGVAPELRSMLIYEDELRTGGDE